MDAGEAARAPNPLLPVVVVEDDPKAVLPNEGPDVLVVASFAGPPPSVDGDPNPEEPNANGLAIPFPNDSPAPVPVPKVVVLGTPKAEGVSSFLAVLESSGAAELAPNRDEVGAGAGAPNIVVAGFVF